MQIFGWVISWHRNDIYWKMVELSKFEREISQISLLLEKEDINPVPDAILKHELRRILRTALAKYHTFLRENPRITSTDISYVCVEGDKRTLVTPFAKRPE